LVIGATRWLDGLRDPGLLDSALMQPEAAFFYGSGDLAAVAAAYAFHVAQNQPFIDGNRRTAIASALVFHEINGIDVTGFNGDALYDAMIAIAEKRLDKAGLAEVFRTQLARGG
jgi:death on curing protein